MVFRTPEGLKNTTYSGTDSKEFVSASSSSFNFGFTNVSYTNISSSNIFAFINLVFGRSELRLPWGNRNGLICFVLSGNMLLNNSENIKIRICIIYSLIFEQ